VNAALTSSDTQCCKRNQVPFQGNGQVCLGLNKIVLRIEHERDETRVVLSACR